jgi:hypothetical protein
VSELTLLRPSKPARTAALAVYSLAGIAWIIAMILLEPHLREKPLASMTVVNPTVWDVGVDIVTDNDSRMLLATMSAETTRTIDEIAQPDGAWVLSWRFRGSEILRTSMSDADLEANGYSVEVPDEVTTFLRTAGTPPAP